MAQAATRQNNEEGEKMNKFRKVFELSHSDVRTLLYSQLDPTLDKESDSFIADVYDTYFIVKCIAGQMKIAMTNTLSSITQEQAILFQLILTVKLSIHDAQLEEVFLSLFNHNLTRKMNKLKI